MAYSPKKTSRLPGGILLSVLCLLSIVLATVWVNEGQNGPLHSFRNATELVIGPLESVGSVVSTPFRALGNVVTSASTSSETVNELQEKNEELSSQLIKMEEYRQENERLSQLLGLKDAYKLDSVGARVISISPEAYNRTITINKGTSAGLSVGMPVCSANGLIGQIEYASSNYSVVRLITDEISGVSAFVQTSRVEGILTGSIDGVLHLEFVALGTEINVGDPIITSGSGGVYPKGIPIGEVMSVSSASSDVYLTIVVRPITKVTTYEEVLVIIGSEADVESAPQSGTNGTADTGTAQGGASDNVGNVSQDGTSNTQGSEQNSGTGNNQGTSANTQNNSNGAQSGAQSGGG